MVQERKDLRAAGPQLAVRVAEPDAPLAVDHHQVMGVVVALAAKPAFR